MTKALSTVYEGRAENLEVTVDGNVLDPARSQAVCNHSPDGFNWGYGGSGPAQLALAILLDFYGDRGVAYRYHQAFKWAVIAPLPQGEDWVLTGGRITIAMGKLLEEGRPHP